MTSASIGIFDSGFGGLTVMRAVVEALPHENIVYFGDTARLPYGEKSAEAILRYTLESVDFLLSKKIKLLIVACNTACTAALETLEKTLHIPVIGMIQPAMEEIAGFSQKQHIAVIGTRRTIRSGLYQQQLASAFPEKKVTALACPLFVPLIEEGYLEHALADLAVREYLRPLKNQGIDIVLLACTHYPLLQTAISKELGEAVTLIDPAIACAKSAYALLLEKHLLNTSSEKPHYEFYVSDDPEKFRELGKIFLGHQIDHAYHAPNS